MNQLSTKQVIIDPTTIEAMYDVLKMEWLQRWKHIIVEVPFKTFIDFLLRYMNLYRTGDDASFIADMFCRRMDLPPISDEAFLTLNNVCKELQQLSRLVNPHLDGMRLVSINKHVLVIEIQAHVTISNTTNPRPANRI